ncbi:MAG: hypothetical protein V2I54_08530 [Bacteroidales bacterium]|jgi:hypothetical protein|nr:hypothetical protein [Bacteroidales bacterium]
MKNDFICPHCKGYLNVGEFIILAAETSHNDSGLILMNPELGNYSVVQHKDFRIQEGEKYDFYCPICHEKLAADIHDNLSHILMVDEKGTNYQILFSKIAGEKSTYKIIGESVEIFGDHHSNYIDFINLSHIK